MPLNSKEKGSNGEREAIALLTLWGSLIGYKLTLTRNLEQVRSGGADINGVPGLSIEVKRVEADQINQWWTQVCKVADKQGTQPMLMYRRNRHPWEFRTLVWIAHYGTVSTGVTSAVVDLTLEPARVWFQGHLTHNLPKD